MEKTDVPKTPGPKQGARNKNEKEAKSKNEKDKVTAASGTNSLVTTSFGNSHLIASCLMLLTQF